MSYTAGTPSVGTHCAVLVEVKDLGEIEGFSKFTNKVEKVHKVRLRYETEETDLAGRRKAISEDLRLSLHEKSNLRTRVAALRGLLRTEWLGPDVDLEKLVGQNLQLIITHAGRFANIADALKAKPDVILPVVDPQASPQTMPQARAQTTQTTPKKLGRKAETYVWVEESGSTSEIQEHKALPEYPLEVWKGTLYEEFADICSKDNFIPKSYLIESLKTVTGAVLGGSIEADAEGGLPRFYAVLTGPGGLGKSTAIGYAASVFADLNLNVDLKITAPLVWAPQTKIESVVWKHVGVCREAFNSAVGMQKSNERGQARWLQIFGELSSLIQGSQIEGSGESMLANLRDLYDSEDYTTTTTAKREAFRGRAQNTILAATTPELWTSLFSGRLVHGSGLFQRFSLVVSQENRRKGQLRKPDLRDLKRKFADKIQAAEAACTENNNKPVMVPITDEARGRLDAWFSDERFRLAKADESGRLNVLCLRNALHLAWIRGLGSIDVQEMESAIFLSEYQFQIRKLLMPIEGRNERAKIENTIRKYLRETKIATRTKLSYDTRLTIDYGEFAVTRALNALLEEGVITRR